VEGRRGTTFQYERPVQVSKTAPFRRIAGSIRSRIEANRYPAGSMLPSESELCREFGAARTTIRRALTLVEGEGLVVVIPAKGRAVKGESAAPPYRYQMIADDLREQIRQGELQAGSILLSEAKLRRRYGVSRNTIRQALAILEEDGSVTVERGRGRFVRLIEDGPDTEQQA
jgi:DNA-binding GntR family transcriptional regulator